MHAVGSGLAIALPDYPRHPSRSGLGFARVPGPIGGRDGIGGRVAARGQGPERGRVPGAVRHRGGVPRGAVRHALARGPDLPGLRPPRLLSAQDPQGLQVHPLKEAGLAHRRHRVPGQQAAADRLVRGDLPPDPGEERDQLDRAGAAARGAAADGLAGEAQADAGHGRARGREAEARGPGRGRPPGPAPRAGGQAAHLGGERSGGERGRGAAGKAPIVAAVETTAERKPGRLRLTVVEGFREREMERLAKATIEPGSDVVSDGLSCWPAVEKAGCTHSPIVTGSGKRAASLAPFRWVNTTLGNIKTAIAGTYHHVSPKHAQHYLTSFGYRFNRRFQLDTIVERLAWAAVRTAPQPYRVVTADA